MTDTDDLTTRLRAEADSLESVAPSPAAALREAADRIGELEASHANWHTIHNKALARITELERWRAEGLAVLDEWEQVYDMVPHPPETLGLTKASVVKAEIERLRDLIDTIDLPGGALRAAADPDSHVWQHPDLREATDD